MFKVDCIQDALLLEEPFLIPAGFNLEEYWRAWVKGFKECARLLEGGAGTGEGQQRMC